MHLRRTISLGYTQSVSFVTGQLDQHIVPSLISHPTPRYFLNNQANTMGSVSNYYYNNALQWYVCYSTRLLL